MIKNFPSTSLGAIVVGIKPSLKEELDRYAQCFIIYSAAEIESYAQYLLDISLKLQRDAQ